MKSNTMIDRPTSFVRRDVVSWKEYVPPREWTATLSCGHEVHPSYSDMRLSDEDKARIEKEGFIRCYACGSVQEEVVALERRLADLKQKLNVENKP